MIYELVSQDGELRSGWGARPDLEGVAIDGLNAHNVRQAIDPPTPWSAEVRDSSDKVVGILVADMWPFLCEIQLLWVDQSRRGEGIGRTLLAKAEQVAFTHGIVTVQVDTFEFQSPDFYIDMGYKEFAVLETGCWRRFFFYKSLIPDP